VQSPAISAAAGQRRLFLASFITLIAAGVGFSIRGGILDDWGRAFGFTQADLGTITGGGLTGFGLIIIFFSLFADQVGYGRLMGVAFGMHVLSAVMVLAATPIFKAYGTEATYWFLYAGTFLFAVANGICESVINPLTATLYPKEKTHYLNILHAGWPAGLILGGLLSWLMSERNGQVVVRWEFQWLLFLVPVLIYGWLMVGQKFPLSEARAAGVTFGTMLKEFAQPVLLALLLLHALVGYVELGTDSWIGNLMTYIANMKGILVLVYTASIMFALRFFAGPIVHRISPLGLLFSCAVLAMIGLFWLGQSTTGLAVFLAATVYGVGKTFFWPTMLGVVSERFPRGGAITLGAIGGIGTLSAGLLGTPGIGYVQDFYAGQMLSKEAPAAYEQYVALKPNGEKDTKSFLIFPRTTGLDGSKMDPVMAKPDAQLNETERTVKAARIFGGRMSLKWTALVPAMMAAGYLVLILYFKAIGGYRQVHIEAKVEG